MHVPEVKRLETVNLVQHSEWLAILMILDCAVAVARNSTLESLFRQITNFGTSDSIIIMERTASPW